MPIYEYACGACDHRLEKLQKLADAPLVDCPVCGQPALTKLVSAAGFQLKGTGWYATDFKPKKQHSSEKSCPGATACGANCPGAAPSE
jgi:putative FmdB family regulatory protein